MSESGGEDEFVNNCPFGSTQPSQSPTWASFKKSTVSVDFEQEEEEEVQHIEHIPPSLAHAPSQAVLAKMDSWNVTPSPTPKISKISVSQSEFIFFAKLPIGSLLQTTQGIHNDVRVIQVTNCNVGVFIN
jgi:hypothetical protein